MKHFGCDKNDKIVALLQIGTAAEKLERDCKPKDLITFRDPSITIKKAEISAFSIVLIQTRLLIHFGFYFQTLYSPLKTHRDHNLMGIHKILNLCRLALKAVYFYANQWI